MAPKNPRRTKSPPAENPASQIPHLTVKDFGPIRSCDLPIQDLLVLIGEQASGKSTLAKLLYFFQSLPKIVDENADRLARGKAEKNWERLVRSHFKDSFGTLEHRLDFEIRYLYSPGVFLRLHGRRSDGFTGGSLNEGLWEAIIERIEVERADAESKPPADPLRIVGDPEKDRRRDAANRKLYELTGCGAPRVFVPSARSLLSVLSAQLLGKPLPDFDPLMTDFIRRIAQLQRSFTGSLESQVEEALHATLRDVPVDRPRVEMAIALVRSVLKGNYVYAPGQERIDFGDSQHVLLRLASSGQQEVLWILLLLFSIILRGTPATILIEEPEAHLFPFAQREVTNLVALCKNATRDPRMARNGAVLTTHSPYVLAALNNLLYAHQVGIRGAKVAGRVAAVVDKQLWLDPADVGVWFVENGKIRSIMDPELRLIQAEEIDGVSSALRGTFDAIAEIEDA